MTLIESLWVALINIIAILMISAKLALSLLLELKVFVNKGYDVIISVHIVTNEIFSSE